MTARTKTGRFEVIRVQAPPIPTPRIARLGMCVDCSRPMRLVYRNGTAMWVDEQPTTLGALLINGDRVIGERPLRPGDEVGFEEHRCGGRG